MGSQQKKKKGTPDPRLIVSDIKREADQAAVRTALEPTTEVGRNPIIRSMIDFVNVTETIDPVQNGLGQITGLSATPVSNTQINLAWAAYSPTPPGFTNYNVYHSTTPGFTPAVGNLLTSPVSNSYNHTGLTICTNHYYQVTGAASGGVEGAPSNESGGTTTGCVPLTPLLSLSLNNNYTNSGSGGFTIGHSGAAFATPGKFGTHYSNFNPSGTTDMITSSTTNLDYNSVGFSVSFWIQPKDLTVLSADRQVFCWQNINSAVLFYILITTDGWYKVQLTKIGGINLIRGNAINPAVNVWNHIVMTFAANTNTLELYVDKSPGMFRPFHGSTGILDGGAESLRIGVGTLTGPGFPTHPVMWLDEFKIFNGVVLTQTQIDNLFSINATA